MSAVGCRAELSKLQAGHATLLVWVSLSYALGEAAYLELQVAKYPVLDLNLPNDLQPMGSLIRDTDRQVPVPPHQLTHWESKLVLYPHHREAVAMLPPGPNEPVQDLEDL
jgi:hypothetical protein